MHDPIQTTITRAEAQERGSLLRVASYTIEVDLTGAASGAATFESVTSVVFACARPGSSTWIDLIAAQVHEAELNGQLLDVSHYDGARLPLPGLAADNELRIRAACSYSTSGEGLHRAVDPADARVYLYTQFATAEARRVFACFEQPDLKATFAWHVRASADWTVVSTSATPPPQPEPGGWSRWSLPPTPPLSTYLAVLVAGPYHSVRETCSTPSGAIVPLGLHVRRSMAEHLDAPEIVEITRAGLAHFEAMFGVPYPFDGYDQIFVPEFNLGAMENPGAVTFNEDHFVFRTAVTDAAREARAVVILHEMAHMWFGDLVTMRWWDDVWLNESFAEWAGTAAAAEVTRFTEAWTTFAQSRKAWAYQADQQPSTHPVAADMVDLEAVYSNFDGITYAKGASVIRQLVAYVGRDAFERGLTTYFRAHAWGSATLADLLRHLSAASGRDLEPWARVWLQVPGVTSAAVTAQVDAHGRYRAMLLEQRPATRPESVPDTLRPHRIAVGSYARAGGAPDAPLVRTAHAEVDLPGPSVSVAGLVGLPAGDLLVVNDDDLTYVKGRLDPDSLLVATAPRGVGALAHSLPRALVWGMLWEHVRDADLPAQAYVTASLGNLAAEPLPQIIETVLRQAHHAVERLAAPSVCDLLAERLCAGTADLLDQAEPGSDRQRALARSHIEAARRPAALDRLDALRRGRATLPGLPLDEDLTWAVVVRLAAHGRLDDRQIDEHLARDHTSKGRQSAARAHASRPDPQAKAAAWETATTAGAVPNAVLAGTVAGFSHPSTPRALLAPYGPAYVDQLPRVYPTRTPVEARVLADGLFPPVSEQARAWADELLAEPELPSGLRRVVRERRAEVELALRCQAASAQAAGVRTSRVGE